MSTGLSRTAPLVPGRDNSPPETNPVQEHNDSAFTGPATSARIQSISPVMQVDTLAGLVGCRGVRVVDVRASEQCPDGHIPGAIQIDIRTLTRKNGAAEALLPAPEDIARVLGNAGIAPDDLVVAYDDGPGVDAARLLWTLDVIGHPHFALLNGGFAAWEDAEHETDDDFATVPVVDYPVPEFGREVIDSGTIRAVLGDPHWQILDTRTRAEYDGEDVRAARGGHIPGAVHFDWIEAVDMIEEGRLRAPRLLLSELSNRGIKPDRPVIVYCQSNRRSSHTYLVLKWLGFGDVRAYAGSWSEWGNLETTPIET